MKYTIKPDPDALDLTNRPQHLLSPSIENEDDDEEEEEYLHSEDEQHHDQIQETSDFILKVNLSIDNLLENFVFFLLHFRKQPMIVVLLIQVMRIMN
jgi:hypothetical protein